MPTSQAQQLSEALTPLGAANEPSTGAKVIIPSALQLTAEQEERMLQHFKNRINTLEHDLGRVDFENNDWLQSPVLDVNKVASSFMGRRHLAHLVAQQRMEWRQYLLGGLYRESNLHLPITSRIITQQSARAQKAFFGTKPYFAVAGHSNVEGTFAQDLQAWASHELETVSGIHSDLETAIDLAFIQGESVVKTRKNKVLSHFESYRTIAIDPQSGEPFIAEDGDYIYQTDIFEEQLVPQIDANTQQPLVDEATGQPAMIGTGKMVLKRDGKTLQPYPDMASTMQTHKINLTKVLRDRVEARPIYYLDFLCPLDASDIQEADVCVHLYNAPVIELATRFLTDESFGDQSPEDQLLRLKRLTESLMPGTAESTQAAGDRSRGEMGEQQQTTGRSRDEPMTAMAESWGHYDPFGDGVQRSIMVLMDKEGRVPIYYDYVANLTDDGLRPLDCVRINRPAGRWHGQGNVERFWNLQVHADLLINRSLFAESKAARVDFWNPHLTVEGRANPDLALNWGGTYTVADANTDPKKILQPVYLENIKSQNLGQMLQTILQMAQNMSAISNVNDGAMAGLDTAKLATGIKNLEASGEEMFHIYMAQLRAPLESILRRALRLVVKDIQENRPKIIRFLDRESRLIELDPLRLIDLDLNVTLTLSTYRGQQEMQQGQTAYTTLSSYFKEHPIVQTRLFPAVTQIIRALEMKDAEKIAAPLTMQEWAIMFPPQLPAAPAASPI